MTDWLYPLSSKSGFWFELPNGGTRDTGPTSFARMIREGARDDKWGANKNWRNAQPKDRVWVYYGTSDGDLGIVALAEITEIKKPRRPRGRATISLKWKLKITKRLQVRPFPALQVRKYIPRAQGAMYRVPERLAKELNKHTDGQSAPPTPSNSSKPVITTIHWFPPKGKITAVLRHDVLLESLKERLLSSGWKQSPLNVDTKRVDLAVKKGSTTIIVEAKTIKHRSAQDVRDAFSQLSEYRWRSTRNQGYLKPVLLWALFEKEPKKDEVQFLEDHGLLVSWASRRHKRILHGPRTGRNPNVRQLN